MLVLGSVHPVDGKSRKYGEFGLTIYLSSSELKKLMWALNFEPHIDLAYQYFTSEHLEEALQNGGMCTLTACWQKSDACSRNDSELESDAMWLKDWLHRAKWHGFQHDAGLGLLVTYYKPMCDLITDGEIHPDDLPDLESSDYWSDYRREPRNFEYCKFYGFTTYWENIHYETISESLGIEWCG
ncbi:hypothetical protein [Nostoc sp. WHI]|uniref:hypothetical protein n=1 Tax=Nostoc sp. WHI TaxID=2650611 RepID=UPI0018C4F544|nr:hypothetical protein [Nostoc sp. WHI]MBG1265069.1 hypothetical protein [Nostoc sp. WHI]